MPDSDKERDPLEALAAEFVERQRRGERPAISEYAARHPELADGIRELFPTIAAMERLKERGEPSSSGLASLGAARPERLGDFRIIREIGRGGMGIVYEAEQESLHRPVAIKVLPRHSLPDAGDVERFKRESQLAAALHHTNIVPVFGVGEQEGFHYYVMQLVRGVSLEAIVAHLAGLEQPETAGEGLRGEEPSGAPPAGSVGVDEVVRHWLPAEGPSNGFHGRGPFGRAYWQAAASVGLQVADAVRYAHSQGVLHRDIKPGNLMVDELGHVWITDFGLAKAVHSHDLTHTGHTPGTPRYMAPEQFSGRSDERSDIYSLGMTLYELLTLRPAYHARDRLVLIDRIMRGEPARPRTLNPRVPRDLETIILKAISREPEHRYASAGALAADFQLFLEGRPIRARRTSAAERAWRWCRRNPAVAALTGTTALLVVLVAVVATIGFVRTRIALRKEAQQRARAEANAELAIEALDRIFGRFDPVRVMPVRELALDNDENASVEIPSQPVLSPATAAMLEDMLVFYDRLARQEAHDERLPRKVAEANRRVGDIRFRLGQYDQAASAYSRAITLYEDISRRLADSADVKTETARIRNELGRVYQADGQADKAWQSHLDALTILAALSAKPSDVRYELARTHYFLGTREPPEPGSLPPIQEPGGPRPGEAPQFRPGPRTPGPNGPEGGPLRAGPLPRGPAAPPSYQPQPAREPGLPASTGTEAGSERRARAEHIQKAIGLLDELADESPANPSYKYLLALCLRERFRELAPRSPQAAVGTLERATGILEALARDHADVPDYRFELSETYAALDVGHPLLPGYDARTAEERFRKALVISEKLVAENPHIPLYATSMAHIHHRLATVLERGDRLAESEQVHRAAVRVQSEVMGRFPDAPYYKVWLGVFQNSLAQVLLRRDRLDEARSVLEDAAGSLSDLVAKHPDLWYVNGLLERDYRMLSRVLRRSGWIELASEAERRAEACRKAVDAGQRGGARQSERPADRPK